MISKKLVVKSKGHKQKPHLNKSQISNFRMQCPCLGHADNLPLTLCPKADPASAPLQGREVEHNNHQHSAVSLKMVPSL